MALFALVAQRVGKALDVAVRLDCDGVRSGPAPGDDDPFAAGLVDFGFLCAPSYRALVDHAPPSVRLVGAAPVWCDERNGGKPVYFAELVVSKRGRWAAAETMRDLAGAKFGYNDCASMSGWHSLVARVRGLGLGDAFLGEPSCTGGHLQSLTRLNDGTIDAAAIDANTLLANGGLPDGLRLVETLGPFPVQPVVASRRLDRQIVDEVRHALLHLHDDADTARALAALGVRCFVPVTDDDYR
jgi:phosphonate transport system substrate-binding protein